MTITINVKESAYDKIIYFLSHFKDDVVILNREEVQIKAKKSNDDYFFNSLRKRALKVDKNINIDDMMNEMNNGLS